MKACETMLPDCPHCQGSAQTMTFDCDLAAKAWGTDPCKLADWKTCPLNTEQKTERVTTGPPPYRVVQVTART